MARRRIGVPTLARRTRRETLRTARRGGYGELWTDEAEQEVELARIIVDPDYRGRGVGKRLVCMLLERASVTSLPDAFVRVVPENGAAIACYVGAGFSPVPEKEREEFNSGQPVDYVWMHYPLGRIIRHYGG